MLTKPHIYRSPGPGHVDAAAGPEPDRGHRLQLLAEAAVSQAKPLMIKTL